MDLTELLPEDMLAEVLSRLPPRSLAAARCVRKAWRATANARRLLDLFPLSLAGLFINFHDFRFSEFFARPSRGVVISGKLHYVGTDCCFFVEDHCNGLLLLYNHVVNPATRRWAPLPPCPPPLMGFKYFGEQNYIVFDLIVSPHYEVFIIPHPHRPRVDLELDPAVMDWEWPPSLFKVHVFSSAICRWEERSFVRQGEAIGTVVDMQLACAGEQQYGVYWHGELYVHRHFVMRLSGC